MIEAIGAIEEIVTRTLSIGVALKKLAFTGLRLAKDAEEYVAAHPILVSGPLAAAVMILIGVAIYKGMHRKSRSIILAVSLLAVSLAGTIPEMNAYFSDRETSSGNVIQAATIFYQYSTGGYNNAVTYEEQNQKRSLVWIQNDETSFCLVIDNIQLIHPSFQETWIGEMWASPQHSQASEGKLKNATIGPGEKRWIWMRIDYASATCGEYGNPVVTLTVNGSTIDIGFDKISVN